MYGSGRSRTARRHNNPDAGADSYTFLFASLMVLIFGAGLFSLDKLFAKWIANRIDRE